MHSHSFLMSPKFETQGCQWYGVKQINSIFADKRNSETRIGARGARRSEGQGGAAFSKGTFNTVRTALPSTLLSNAVKQTLQ